jgi:hypothetical protein
MKEWDAKRKWWMRGTGFLVEVSHHTVKVDEPACYDSEGPNRWCVYAYIYPKHSRFGDFELDTMWQEAIGMMPLHACCSFLDHMIGFSDKDGNVDLQAIKVGADYNHLGDNGFTRADPDDDSWERKQVFDDAQELFDYLQRTEND